MKDAEAVNSKVDEATMATLRAQCRSWYTVKIVRHDERVALESSWLEHADGERGYVWSPKVKSEDSELLDARFDVLSIREVAAVLYGVAP